MGDFSTLNITLFSVHFISSCHSFMDSIPNFLQFCLFYVMKYIFFITIIVLCHGLQILNQNNDFMSWDANFYYRFYHSMFFYSPIIDDINLYTFILCTLKFQYNYHTCNKGKPTFRLSFVTFTSIFY